jgi:carboxymethylenebutenolidase
VSGLRDRVVSFPGNGRTVDGYLALPDGDGRAPAIVLIHEIWGLDEHIRDVARRLAGQGYATLAPDLYTGAWREVMQPERIMAGMAFLRQAPPEVQRDPARMREVLASRSPEERRALETLMQVMAPQQRSAFADDLTGAVRFLAGLDGVEPTRIASLGFCMGGGLSGLLATRVPELWKAVIFYGEHPPLDRIKDIQARVFGIYGGRDYRITDLVPEFQRAMEEAGKPFTYKVYGGAQHAFFNDTRPSYDAAAAADAWLEVLRFLAE